MKGERQELLFRIASKLNGASIQVLRVLDRILSAFAEPMNPDTMTAAERALYEAMAEEDAP